MGGASASEASPRVPLLSERGLRWVPPAYLAATIVVAVARAATGHPTTSAFALTPDRLGAGRVWLFATSALIVNGPPVPQLVGLVPTLVVTQRRFGARFTTALMPAAHVGATLLAYALLAVVTGDADGAHNHELDYGVSAVWMGALGALWALALTRRDRPLGRIFSPVGIAVFVGSVIAFPLLAAIEHGFAFAIGAAAGALSANGAQASVGRLDAAHPRRAD